MRIAVDHRTSYRFAEPQARVVQMLRLMPSDTRHQTVVSWHVEVGCDARLRHTRDGFGNAVAMLYAEGPVEALEISVSGEVLTAETSGIVRDSHEPLPPLLYLRATPRTRAAGELDDFARQAVEGVNDAVERLHQLSLALGERFELAPVGRDRGHSAGAVFATERACPRDLAHMFVSAARGLGVPSRYVAGYRHCTDEGECMPHAWAEAHIDGLGWVGFDPSAGISADERYVRVAVGLDATGAAPIVGHRMGGGEEALDVALEVERLGAEE